MSEDCLSIECDDVDTRELLQEHEDENDGEGAGVLHAGEDVEDGHGGGVAVGLHGKIQMLRS